MNNTQMFALKTTSPDEVGTNNLAKKKLSKLDMFKKYLTSPGKALNLLKNNDDFKNKLNELLNKKKRIVNNDFNENMKINELIDKKQIDYSKYKEIFEIIIKNQGVFLQDDSLKKIFTQTRDSKGAQPSNIEVFLYRFLIINIFNIDNLIHDYDDDFIRLIEFFFKIPYNYIEECVFLLSVVFDDLTALIHQHILDPNSQIDAVTNQFIEKLSFKCVDYLIDARLTDNKHFTIYEMQQFLQAHLVDQMKYICPEKIKQLNHIVTALMEVSFDISKKDIHFFYDPLIKSTSDFILTTLKNESNNNDNDKKNFIFFLMEKIFSISNEIYNKISHKKNTSELIESSNKFFQTLLIDYAQFIDFIIDTNEWVNSFKGENFTNFSEKETNLFNNDKNYKEPNSSIIESRDKRFVFNLTELRNKSFREDDFSIIKNTYFSFNDGKFHHLNKFIKQIKQNKIVSMLILKELLTCILTQMKEKKTIKSAAKMLVFINILINILNDFSQEDFDKISDQQQIKEQIFSTDLVESFVFDEKYFYFSNPTSKTSALYYFLHHSNNDSVFNLTDQSPADLNLYEEIRKSVLSLFCNHFQLLPTNFITLIMRKIDYSVQPQISNYFISMLRSFYYKWPDLTIEYMKSMSFFDSFVDNYLLRLRNYYIFYRKNPNNSFVSDYVQMYRFNSLMFIIQLSKNPIHFQVLFSSSKVVDYFLQYRLFEEDNCTLVIELIKLAIEGSNVDNNISVSSESKNTVNNITTSLIKTIEICTDSISKNIVVNDTKDQPFDYASYCLQLLHNILVMIGECLQTKMPAFSQSLINHNLPLFLCQIPNKIIPINNQLKLDIINDILYIIYGMTKDSNEIKKRFIGPMKKCKLAELLNSIEFNDKTIQYLLMLIFEEEIKLSQNTDTDSDQSQKKLIYIKFNKALPFLHIALLNKPQYKQIFLFIYEITLDSFTNKIQIYKSKLLSLFISEIQKYSDIDKITKEKFEALDLMFNIYKIVTSCLAKPQTLLETLKALQKKDNNERPWYVSKFIRNFNIILSENNSSKNKKTNIESGSTSFYHFNGHKTGISVPQFSIADKKSFSFVCRFQLHEDYESTNIRTPIFLSFSVNNYKIKLFFKQNKLNIKLKNKTTKSKSESEVGFSFENNKWYTLVLSGKSNDKLELFIDGAKPVYTESKINFLFDTFSSFVIANSSLEKDKGLSCNISVIYFFNQAISLEKIKDLNLLTYKFTYLFTPSNQCLYQDLPLSLFDEKFEKSLIFCYNSNMFDGHSAINLARGTSTVSEVNGLNVPYNSSFIGAIASLGGIKAFLPLLEIVDLHSISINDCDEHNDQLLITIIEIFTFLNKSSPDFENEFCNSNGIQAFAQVFSKISKSNINKFVLSSLYNFYLSFRRETNLNTFLKIFWFNYNIWDKLTLEQYQDLLSKYEELYTKNEELFKKYISYPFLLAILKDIKDDKIRELFFTFVDFYSQHYFVKPDQKFMLHLGFASEGVFQGQIMKIFYTIIERGNDCFNRLYGTNVYSNLIGLSSSSNEETRIYAIKILLWMRNKNKKEPIPLNSSILSFIKTLNYENITDQTWNELEKSIFVENKLSERIIELLPLLSSYSHYSDPKLSHNFIQKLNDITIKNHENYKTILLSPNWTLNLFYIYLNSKKPILNFSEKDTIIDFFENILLFLINSQNIDEYRNILNELYLIQFIHYFDVSLLLRQIFISILKRKETESPKIYKIILPDVFIHLFYLPTYNVGSDVFSLQSSFDHSNQDLNWVDFIRSFNFNSKSISKNLSCSSVGKDDTANISDIDINLANKVKIDFSNFKGGFATRITPDGKWADLELVDALTNQFINIMSNLKEKQVDKYMITSGHNSFKLPISCYDFFVIIEMICINLGVKVFNEIIHLLCSNFLRNSSNKKQSLQIICYLTLQTIDNENRAEILYGNIKSEFQKEIESFAKKEKRTLPMEKSSQVKFLEYISKGCDIFDLINTNCIEFFKNTKDLTVLAKSSLEMIHQESHVLVPRTNYVKQFTDQYPLVLLNMKNICLSAYQKISKEIISYENNNNKKTNLHWRISKRIDTDLRHIYYKINDNFDYDKYRKLAKSANENSQSTSNLKMSEFKTSSKKLVIDDNDLNDNDDDDYINSEESNINEIDEDEGNITPQNSSNENIESTIVNIQKENKIFKAVLIMVSKHYSGKLSINENEITFIGKEMNHLMNSTAIPEKYLKSKKDKKKEEIYEEETNQETTSNTKTIQFRLSDIYWFLLRNYLHIKEGFEVFLVNHKSYFFFLTDFNRISFIKLLTKYQKSLTNCKIFQTSREQISQIIQETQIVERWTKGYISNYNYLVTLNLLAGRSFNDTTQYPVFPWILKEYNKEEIDLEDESIYRDLSRPINTLGEGRLEQLIKTYNEVDDDEDNKVHNRSFYINDASVSILLIRTEPFTTTYINTQHYFDLSRFPRSLCEFYEASIGNNGFELIPEYFTTPEVFVNNDKDIVYGNDSYNKMELPKWCIDQNPFDFVKKHRLALESDYVSSHLNEWIDLIFGFAQFGKEAVKRYNTFPPKLYSRYLAKHINQIQDDPFLFQNVQDIAFNFGIVPDQIFTEKHPQKVSRIEKMPLFYTNKFSNKLKSVDFTNVNTFNNLIVNYSTQKQIPLFTATNENKVVVLSSDLKLFAFQSKSSLPNKDNESKSLLLKQVSTDLSMFVLLKNDFIQTIKSSAISTTKGFVFLSDKLVVTSPLDPEIRIFQIQQEDFNIITESQISRELTYQDCLDLTYQKPPPGTCVFGLYSTIQLPNAVLMTCKAGEEEFLSVSSDFSVMKWSFKESLDDKINDEITTTNNYEFGSKSGEQNTEQAPKIKPRRKSSLASIKIKFLMNKVKMIYRIIPHSTKIIAIDACNKINVIASCDKENNLTLSRLNDGAFIRSFKTLHKVKSLIVSETPCIVVSQISKNDDREKEDDFDTSIETFALNNNKNDNFNEEPISKRVFNKRTLTTWCEINDGFGFDNYLACCFDDKSLVILSLPMLDVVHKSLLVDNATHVTFNNEYSTLVVACKNGGLYKLKC